MKQDDLEIISDSFRRSYEAIRCEHLRKSRVSYCSHLYRAISYSYYSAKASIIFAIHGFCPFLFESSGSELITRMADSFPK
jgi:hypothetical protein